MNIEKLNKKYLINEGFIEQENEFANTRHWVWGNYTVKNASNEKSVYIPIIVWDEQTQLAYASPLDYYKKISTIQGMNQFIDSVNFLMSTES